MVILGSLSGSQMQTLTEADRSDVATSPGPPGATYSLGRQEVPSPGASGGHVALGHLDGPLASSTRENEALCVKPPVCGHL